MAPTNLRDCRQVRHALKVVGREISITSRFGPRHRRVDLRTKLLLTVAVLGQLPERKGQLENLSGAHSKNAPKTTF